MLTLQLSRTCFLWLACMFCFAAATSAAPPVANSADNAIATTFARLIEGAIPVEYDKKKDWGKTKTITVGIRNDGLKIRRRKKAVNHGVWKHYRVKLVDPKERFSVEVENLHAIDNGRIAFTMVINAKLDTWARAKVYQYGVHLIAFEMVGDTDMKLSLECEVGVQLHTVEGLPSVTIDPRVADAQVAFSDFHLRRVSNAKGPLVKELSSGLRRAIQHELKGPKLTAKLNRAIDKKRDRLVLSMSELLNSTWWPLAKLPDVDRTTLSR